MAITQEQLAAAQQQEADAYTAWQAAEAELDRINKDPSGDGPQGQAAMAAKNHAISLGKTYQAAKATNKDLKAQSAKENPPAKPKTDSEKEKEANATKIQQQIARNGQETGFYEDDAHREAREKKNNPGPKPPTTPNAAQIQNSNTQAASAAETARNNAVTAANRQAEIQVSAQKEAIDATNNRRNQLGQEAVERTKQASGNIDQVRGAATALLSADTTQRQQDIELAKARQSFFSEVQSGVFSGIVQLLKMGSGGSKAARAFAAAYLAMANSNYVKAGFDKPPAAIDQNSPEVKALRKISGYDLPDKQPTMPTSDELDWATMVGMARAGNPPPGWRGPIGAAAMNIPATPENIAKYTGLPPQTADQKAKQEEDRQAKAASDTPEGKALLAQMPAEIVAIVQKQKANQTLTPDEQQKLDAYRGQVKPKLIDIYNQKNPGQAKPVTVPAAAASEVAQPGDPGYGVPVAPTPPAGTNIDKVSGMPMTPEQQQAADKTRESNGTIDFSGSNAIPSIENTFAPKEGDSVYAPMSPKNTDTTLSEQQPYKAPEPQYPQASDVPDFSADNPQVQTTAQTQADNTPDYGSLFDTQREPYDDDYNPYNFTFNS